VASGKTTERSNTMKAAILVLDKCTGHWMTPEGAYSIKVGFADGEFTPVKWLD
jgi:hypothetical protein